MKNDFAYLVLEIVQEIPKGKVASYKQIAALAGKPKNARQVGKILSHAEFYGDYPCHRVVNAVGRLVEGWQEQHILLANEGVIFKENGDVDMKKCQWDQHAY